MVKLDAIMARKIINDWLKKLEPRPVITQPLEGVLEISCGYCGKYVFKLWDNGKYMIDATESSESGGCHYTLQKLIWEIIEKCGSSTDVRS